MISLLHFIDLLKDNLIHFYNGGVYNEKVYHLMIEVIEEFKDPYFEHLNRGGCGIFAYNLGRILKKKNVPFKFVWLDGNSHVVVKAGGFYCDSNGMFSLWDLYKKGYRRTTVTSKENLKEEVKDASIWNKTFDRNKSTKVRLTLEKCHLNSNFFV